MAADTVKLTRMERMGFAIEATTGTAATLDAATAACLVMDPSITPDFKGLRLPRMAGFGGSRFIKGQAKGTASFSDYMTGIGSGDGVHSDFLLACGAVNAGGVYSFTHAAGGTATIGVYRDGLLDKLYGAMGNCVLTIRPGEPVMRKFDFQGAYAGRSDDALPAGVTDPTLIAPVVVSSTITIGGSAYVWDEMTIDLGNQIILRADAASASGIRSAWITDRTSTVRVSPESSAAATFAGKFGHATTQTAALSVAVGGTAGNIFTIAASLALSEYPGLVDQNGRVCDALAWEVVDESLTITHT